MDTSPKFYMTCKLTAQILKTINSIAQSRPGVVPTSTCLSQLFEGNLRNSKINTRVTDLLTSLFFHIYKGDLPVKQVGLPLFLAFLTEQAKELII